MRESEDRRVLDAAQAARDEMAPFIRDPSPHVLKSLLANSNITEQEVLTIANRKDIGADVLEAIARDKRWAESYHVRLALARNPRSPLSVSLSMARFLRVFDLEEITRSHYIPLVFRHKVESMIVERVPTMPPGNKKTLAKKAAGKLLLKLLQDHIPEVVRLCLDNPRMSEGHLYKVINRPDTSLETILMIAEHPVWSRRPLVRFALARNPITPLSVSVHYLRTMKLVDLRELYRDPSLPVTIKPLVHRELLARGSDPEKADDEKIYEVSSDDIADADELITDEIDDDEGSKSTGEQAGEPG